MGVLFNSAKSAATDGLLSTREVGKLISKALDDGRVHQGEIADLKKIQTEFYDELTPQARRALRSFLSLGNTFDPGIAGQLFGVTDDVADKLEKANNKTKQELLLASKTPDMRAAIAGAAGIDEVVVTD